jgi:hypothetical protein
MRKEVIMEKAPISQDDLTDVMEMTQKLEHHISFILKENEMTLAMSALMSATINCILDQCQTLDEVIFYRNIFLEIFDTSIRSIKIKEKE